MIRDQEIFMQRSDSPLLLDAHLLFQHAVQSGTPISDGEFRKIVTEIPAAIEANDATSPEFLKAYHSLALHLHPVTGKSLRMVKGAGDGKPGPARRVIFRYRALGVLVLFAVLLVQVYCFVGADLYRNMWELFSDRQVLLDDSGWSWAEVYQNVDQERSSGLLIMNQKLDSNYALLRKWNRPWRKWGEMDRPLTEAVELAYKSGERVRIEGGGTGEAMPGEKAAFFRETLAMSRMLDIGRNRMFVTLYSSAYVLRGLQGYLLPMMYGLLGAIAFILREMNREVRELTFSRENEMIYGLRISMGALAGLSVGWIFQPEDAEMLGSLNKLGLSFLVGYNVDLLFSQMDRMVDMLKKGGDGIPTAAARGESGRRTG